MNKYPGFTLEDFWMRDLPIADAAESLGLSEEEVRKAYREEDTAMFNHFKLDH